MRYSWDGRKNRSNIAKHAIAFGDAKGIFEGPTVEKVDDRFDYGEVRVYARRIISAWRSEPHERRFFWTNVEG
jgi:uncharacterized protein